MFISDLLIRQKENKKTAIKYGNDEITFKDWYNSSHRLSDKLNGITNEKSLNIAILLPNSINYAIAYFSILFANNIIIPINIQSTESEIISTLEYCEVDIIITSLLYLDFLKNCISTYKYRITLLFVEDLSVETLNRDKEFMSKSETIRNIGNEDDVAIMLQTSGTRSDPKRVMLTHRNLINNVESNIMSLKLTQFDNALIAMPMSFSYCNTAQLLTHLYLGSTITILNGLFLPKLFFQIVHNEKITIFTGVPSMLLMLLKYRYIDNYDIKSLRYICIGGSKMPADQLKKLIKTFKSVGFVVTYGQTEASPRITTLLPEDTLRKIGSVGLPIPNVKIKIIDESGKDLGKNKIGEIAVSGKNVMKGYYKQKIITAKTIIDDWLYTNDLGYLDDEGYLYLTGRKTNMIISGGINVYPEEIEEVLLSHCNIKEVCVVPEEHALLGEVPIAKIVVRNTAAIYDYRAFCTGKLADYKIPVRFDTVEQLEKTYNDKIKRNRS